MQEALVHRQNLEGLLKIYFKIRVMQSWWEILVRWLCLKSIFLLRSLGTLNAHDDWGFSSLRVFPSCFSFKMQIIYELKYIRVQQILLHLLPNIFITISLMFYVLFLVTFITFLLDCSENILIRHFSHLTNIIISYRRQSCSSKLQTTCHDLS